MNECLVRPPPCATPPLNLKNPRKRGDLSASHTLWGRTCFFFNALVHARVFCRRHAHSQSSSINKTLLSSAAYQTHPSPPRLHTHLGFVRDGDALQQPGERARAPLVHCIWRCLHHDNDACVHERATSLLLHPCLYARHSWPH